ncbi:MAG: hypothetical protein GY805_18960 [Chloroflexi bacterium]|nr:hypothetical protein [Chloroflexota bacterium]
MDANIKCKVAIVTPMSNRAKLTPDEEISRRHLVHYLGRYDKYLVVPQSLSINMPSFGIERFDERFFGSVAANTQLMLSRQFYERFSQYEYILIYHFDALVFSDDLEQWCERGYDYIGPPWLLSGDTPWVKKPGVGNGGFSLRKISSCLKALNSNRYAIDPDEYWQTYCASRSPLVQTLNFPRKHLKRLKVFNNIQREIANFKDNEDKFWGFRALNYFPEFKIADVDAALRFAFESDPARSFEKMNYSLPFGCHAWPKYDRAFWEPYLLP